MNHYKYKYSRKNKSIYKCSLNNIMFTIKRITDDDKIELNSNL